MISMFWLNPNRIFMIKMTILAIQKTLISVNVTILATAMNTQNKWMIVVSLSKKLYRPALDITLFNLMWKKLSPNWQHSVMRRKRIHTKQM